MNRTRSVVPLEGIKTHGASGYRQGCGCDVCQKGRADEAAKTAAKRRERSKAQEAVAPNPNTGEQERLTKTEIDALGDLNPEAKSVANLALINAKLIDTISAEAKWHLLSPTVRTLRELMKELRGLSRPGGGPVGGEDGEGEEDDFASVLRGFREPGTALVHQEESA